jgi:hypothetical protein
MAAKTDNKLRGLVYFAVGVAALGGLLFGYDTGVISGAILFITKQFSLSATMEEIVVSSVLASRRRRRGGSWRRPDKPLRPAKTNHSGWDYFYIQRRWNSAGANG